MFQFSDLTSNGFAFREDFVASRVNRVVVSELVLPFVDGRLEFQSKFGLVSLDDQMRNNVAQERRSLLADYIPDELVAMDWVSGAMAVDVKSSTVGLLKGLDDGQMGHANADEDLVTDVDAVWFVPGRDANVAFAVEQARSVPTVKQQDEISLSLGWDAGEFGGSPMPGPKGRGRVTPSQAGSRDGLLGVCNEQGPAAKAKACSELHGNMQRSAEMTGPATCKPSCEDYMWQVTDCNTKYIMWRPHRDRNMVPSGDVRSINQDASVNLILWMGNMTVSNASLQGVIFQT